MVVLSLCFFVVGFLLQAQRLFFESLSLTLSAAVLLSHCDDVPRPLLLCREDIIDAAGHVIKQILETFACPAGRESD